MTRKSVSNIFGDISFFSIDMSNRYCTSMVNDYLVYILAHIYLLSKGRYSLNKFLMFLLITFYSQHGSRISSLITSFRLQIHQKILCEKTRKISQAQNWDEHLPGAEIKWKGRAERQTEVTSLQRALWAGNPVPCLKTGGLASLSKMNLRRGILMPTQQNGFFSS